jgi:uroporphyrinogen decarboxylase
MPGGTMTSRERLMAALNHREPDRIPRDFGGTFTTSLHVKAHRELKAFLGFEGGPEEIMHFYNQSAVVDPRIMEKFGSDCTTVMVRPPSSWKLALSTDERGYRSYTDEWGVVRSCPPDGYYYDVVSSPLANAEMADLERFKWPDPADPGRYQGLTEKAKDLYENTDKCIVFSVGTSLFNHIAALMGWEDFLMNLAANPSLVQAVVERVADFNLRVVQSTLDRIGKYVHVFNLAGDMTHQTNLFAKRKTVQDIFIPVCRKLSMAVKNKADIKVLFHICGASHLLFEELISAGVDAVNPVQVAAEGMDDTTALKKTYGDRLTFWGGGCDTQHVLPFGTADDVKREVRRRIADLAPGGGFVFCPVHNIQAGVPPRNIAAMYEELDRWDRYPIQVEELRKG